MTSSFAEQFVRDLSRIRFENVFNPYAQVCAEYDVDDAPQQRKQNLKQTIDAALDLRVTSMWVGRDLGHKGGRRTGLALTDEIHLQTHANMLGIASLSKVTKGETMSESTAKSIWSMIAFVRRPVLLWNVFPFHPHESGVPLSNRTHNSRERKIGIEFLMALVRAFRPREIIAIGGDAGMALSSRSIAHRTIRHPSYGGQVTFRRQIQEIYRT